MWKPVIGGRSNLGSQERTDVVMQPRIENETNSLMGGGNNDFSSLSSLEKAMESLMEGENEVSSYGNTDVTEGGNGPSANIEPLLGDQKEGNDVNHCREMVVYAPPPVNVVPSSSSREMIVYEPPPINVVPPSSSGEIIVYVPPRFNIPPSSSSSPIVTEESRTKKIREKTVGVGGYMTRCNLCRHWRIIRKEEDYEMIRENTLQTPFVCEMASDENQTMSCDLPDDTFVHETPVEEVWAMDKPSIPRTPTGWVRLVKFRARDGDRFADVYYCKLTSKGKKLRSPKEVETHMKENPGDLPEGLSVEEFVKRFVFATPKPRDKGYVKERPSTKRPREEMGSTSAQPRQVKRRRRSSGASVIVSTELSLGPTPPPQGMTEPSQVSTGPGQGGIELPHVETEPGQDSTDRGQGWNQPPQG